MRYSEPPIFSRFLRGIIDYNREQGTEGRTVSFAWLRFHGPDETIF